MFKLMDSTSYGKYLYAGEFIQKTASGPLSYTPNKPTNDNKWFNSRKLQKATKDRVQEPPHEGEAHLPKWWVSHPNGEATRATLEPVALHRLVCVSNIYTVNFKMVLSRFIQRWSRELTWIDDVTMLCPLLHLPYIRHPLSSLGGHLSFRSIYTKREIPTKLSRRRSRIALVES
jgi:hypothetical protein